MVMVVLAMGVSLAGPWTEFALAQPEESPPVNGVGIPTAVTANVPATAGSVYKNILSQDLN